MGFRRTDNVKQLEKICGEVGAAAGQVVTGKATADFLRDIADMHGAEIHRLYAVVVSTETARAARKATTEAQMTAQIWAESGGPRAQVASKKLTHEVIQSILQHST